MRFTAPLLACVAAVGWSVAVLAATTDETYLKKVHLINQAEVKVGTLAEKNGVDASVRRYGAMLQSDHGAADKKVADVATKLKVQLDQVGADEVGELKKKLDTMAGDLEAKKGQEFDKAFADAMVKGHQDAIDLTNAALAGDLLPETKALAQELLPKLKAHHEVAKNLQKTAH